MAYQAWSVVYGEQPTAAKWNILGTNDASFNDGTGIADDAIKVATHLDNPYKFSAFLSASQGSVASGSAQTIVFNGEKYDAEGDFDVTTGIYTVPVTGYYHFDVRWFAYYGGTASPTRVNTYFQVNGGNAAQVEQRYPAANAGLGATLSNDIYLTAGDEVKIRCAIYYSSGAPYVYGDAGGVYTAFNGHLICT